MASSVSTGMASDEADASDRLRHVVVGTDDPRIRATWRVLLAMPLLWTLTGGVLTGNLQSALEVLPSGQATGAGLAQSLLHAGFLLLALVPWARYVERRSLSTYGVSAAPGWVRDGLVGFLAVLVGFGVWSGLTSLLAATTLAVAPSAPGPSGLLAAGLLFVALVLHAAVQQIVFFRVILTNAADGLQTRGVAASDAALAAVPVAVVFFVLMHGDSTPLRMLDLAVAGGIFGLLFLHTGELALGIGAHFGALYGGTVVFSVIRVTGSLSGVPGVIDQYGFPKLVVAYLVLLAWLGWRGELSIDDGSAGPS